MDGWIDGLGKLIIFFILINSGNPNDVWRRSQHQNSDQRWNQWGIRGKQASLRTICTFHNNLNVFSSVLFISWLKSLIFNLAGTWMSDKNNTRMSPSTRKPNTCKAELKTSRPLWDRRNYFGLDFISLKKDLKSLIGASCYSCCCMTEQRALQRMLRGTGKVPGLFLVPEPLQNQNDVRKVSDLLLSD